MVLKKAIMTKTAELGSNGTHKTDATQNFRLNCSFYVSISKTLINTKWDEVMAEQVERMKIVFNLANAINFESLSKTKRSLAGLTWENRTFTRHISYHTGI